MFIFSKYIALITRLNTWYIYRRVGGYTRHFRKSIPVSKGITTHGYYVSRYPSGTGTLRRVPGYFNTHGMPYVYIPIICLSHQSTGMENDLWARNSILFDGAASSRQRFTVDLVIQVPVVANDGNTIDGIGRTNRWSGIHTHGASIK